MAPPKTPSAKPPPAKTTAPKRRRPDRARRLAFDVLRAVHTDGAYANLALAALLASRGLTGRDAAFATELVSGTCRRQGTYDEIIAAAAGRPLTSFQPAVLDLLRLGAHQVLSMRVPVPAAVAAMVDLAAATVGERVTGVTNAVLRRVAAHDLDGWFDQLGAGRDPLDLLALQTSHPRWVVDAFADVLPPDELPAALEADNDNPQVTLVVRPGLAEVAELVSDGARPGTVSPFAARWTGLPGGLAVVRDGRVGVQDEGSQLVAWGLARAEAPAGPWLDLCAGPGGKTALLTGLAAAADELLVSVEPSAHRAGLVTSGVRAYPVDQQPLVLQADGTRPAWRPGSFARVLADVPCTGLGALRRRPESRWRRGAADVEQLHGLQTALLRSAIDAAAPGGLVGYVTCSPHRRETVDVVEEVLAGRTDVTVVPAAQVLPEVSDAASGSYLQLWPHRHGTDAMFAAYLRPLLSRLGRFRLVTARIMPSLLSADFANLQAAINTIPGADALHIDVMDYHFVPNLTLGLPVVEAIRAVTPALLDVHLMIDDPDRWAPAYAEAGADSVTFHIEAAAAPVRLARELRHQGARAAMALKPATPIEPYADLLPELDMVLIMTVEPGFGGQKFLDLCLPKIRRTRALLDRLGGDVWLQIDGGVSVETIERCAAAGVDSFVAGSSVFGAEDPDAMVAELRRLAQEGGAERRP